MCSNQLKVMKKNKPKQFKKSQKLNRAKFSDFESLKQPNFQNTLSGIQKILINRLYEQKTYSRPHMNDNDITKMKEFAQVREHYFVYLQSVIKDNCAYYSFPVTEDILKSLTLALEQNALASSLQRDIYENFMTKIISDIEKCTKEKQIHKEVKKLLPDSIRKQIVAHDKLNSHSSKSKKCSKISTTSSKKTDCNSNTNMQTDQSVCNSGSFNNFLSRSRDYQPRTARQDSNQLHSPSHISIEDDYETISSNDSNISENEVEVLQENDCEIVETNLSAPSKVSSLQNKNMSSNKDDEVYFIPNVRAQKMGASEIADTVTRSQNPVEKSGKQIFSDNENVDKQLERDNERGHVTVVLDSDDSSVVCLDDLPSENEAELPKSNKEKGKETEDQNEKENELETNEDENRPISKDDSDTNLTARVEKMRDMFNISDEKESSITSKKPKEPNRKNNQPRSKHKSSVSWKNEKIIQLYKVSILTSKLSIERREIVRKIFIELFGEDSDEEHEFENGSTEKFRTSCTDRISCWVVKHLMPFYHKKRIIGRNVFKSLGQRISQSVIKKIQYPDERTVKYFVAKFFPPNKNYGCDIKPQPPQPG